MSEKTDIGFSWQGIQKNEPGRGARLAEISFRRAKLQVLGSELRLLYEDRADPRLPALVVDGGGVEPHLLIGASARIDIDPATGLYVFREGDGRGSCILSTGSEERVIDQVASYLTRTREEFAPRTLDDAVDILVGQSLEDVERRLIIRTLVQHRGDRMQAAAALGIPIQQLRAKLRGFWLSKPESVVPQ
jgi:DNA-binding protein Fis